MNLNIPKFKTHEFKTPDSGAVDLRKLKYHTVNRLIMVGNGFDIAHGLNSGFNDFVFDYIKSVLTEATNNAHHIDRFFEIHTGNARENLSWVTNNLTNDNCISRLNQLQKIPDVVLKIKSRLFKQIITEVKSKNWVDIEISYFDLLAEAVEKKNFSHLKMLNEDIESIREKLIEYLSKEIDNKPINFHPLLLKQFCEPIIKKEAILDTIYKDLAPDKYYFLNFNYTNILQHYVDIMLENDSTINYIHGSLNPALSNGQLPIFGFGDELDKKYKDFEDQRDDEVFKHIKSFKYLESNNYRNLMEFVESNPFQIHIYGHSCGVSDRTLLNSIFEHENCISIKIYYYQNGNVNDFTIKNYSISRHFTDKLQLRNKLVNFKYCSPMFQPNGK